MNDAQLRDLLDRYRQLDAMTGRQTQARGQLFNTFLRDMLRAWGVEAHADQRGIRNRDETDVGFSIGRSYYILEAKWTREPINLDPVAKLYLRLKVRPPGTAAVLVSMGGFTGPVREFTEYHPEILLLDRTHIEAMLTGLVDPDQLLHLLFSYTSRRGGSYVPLADLLLSPYPPALPTWSPADDAPDIPAVKEISDQTTARMLWAADPTLSPYTGMTPTPDGVLLLTCEAGVQRLDPRSGQCRWELTMEGCTGPVLMDGGRLLALCGPAVAAWDGENIVPVAGAFPAGSRSYLLPGPAGEPWVFSSTGAGGTWGGTHTLTRLGGHVGAEQSLPIEYVGNVAHAALTDAGDLYIGSYQGGTVPVGPGMRLAEDNWWRTAPLAELAALLPAGKHTVLSAGRSRASGHISLYATDLRTREHTRLLHAQGANVLALAAHPGGCYLLLNAFVSNSMLQRPVLADFRIPTGLCA